MRIVILGSGNVATHLAKTLDKSFEVVQIFSRNILNAELLANSLKKASAINDLSQLINDADVYILSIKDDAILSVLSNVQLERGLWLHTSGSISASVFNGRFLRYGVLYPLQTFSREVYVEMSNIPFFIEGDSEKTTIEIECIAKTISNRVYRANSIQRKNIHVAAVFGCNFVNYLWGVADEILQKSGYDFKILLPLIKTTLDKAINVGPVMGQTGPARRGDKNTMLNHEQLISVDQKNVYKLISECIMRKYNIEYE